MNTLVVDDSSTIRKLIIDALKHAGVTSADEAADGAEAVECCRKRRYDLILLDWNMPKVSGIEALKTIRGIGSRAAIVMVTTEAEKMRVIEAVRDGADSYIIKPFSIPDFAEKIRSVLDKKPPARADQAPVLEVEADEAQAKRMVDPKYLDPIVESVEGVFDTLLGSPIEVKKRGLADSGKRPDHILALIAFSGAMRGTIGLSFPKSTAVATVNRMLMTDDMEVNEELFDGLAEIANIIGGKSKAKLSELEGTVLDLSLPMVIEGNYTIYTPANTLWTELILDSEFGLLYLKVTTESVGIIA